MRTLRLSILVVLLAAACGGSSSKSSTSGGGTTTPTNETAKKSLYERLGGMEAIKAVVDDFVGNVAGDARINARFANADIPHLKQMLADQVCAATGGPCQYTGKNMTEAHAGMGITEDEFSALVEDLVKSLDKLKVGDTEKQELLAALGGMKGEIVGK